MTVAAGITVVAFAATIAGRTFMRDWRLAMIPIALALVGAVQFQFIQSRHAAPDWLLIATGIACSVAALLAVFYLRQLSEDRRRFAESAQMREQWARFLSSRLPALVWTTNRKGTVTSHVGGAHRFARVRQNELAGKTLTHLFGQGGSEAPAWQAFRHAMNGESIALELDWHGQSHEGFVEPVYDDQAGVCGTIGFLVSTDAESVPLQFETDAMLDLASSKLPFASFVLDLDGNLRFSKIGNLADRLSDSAESIDARRLVEMVVMASPRTAGVAVDGDPIAVSMRAIAASGVGEGYRANVLGIELSFRLEPLLSPEGDVRQILGIAHADPGADDAASAFAAAAAKRGSSADYSS